MTELAAKGLALKQQAEQLGDPVRLRYIEALLQRAERLPQVAGALLQKAERCLQEAQRSQQAQAMEASKEEPAKPAREANPNPSEPLQQLAQLCQRLLQAEPALAEPSGEATITAQLAQLEQAALQARPVLDQSAASAKTPSPGELKSMASFRQSWHRLRTGQMAEAVANEAPENPGPLNQHMQTIRLLSSLHELSPAYFSRYLSYMGSLMWLEQASHKPNRKKKA